MSFSFYSTMLSGMCNFCTYHFFIKFSFLKDVADMSSDNRPVFLKQFCHLSLSKPHGLILQLYIKLSLAIINIIQTFG